MMKIKSGQAIILEQSTLAARLNQLSTSSAAKLETVYQLLAGTIECSECGHITEVEPLITEEQAKELLGFVDESE